MSTPTGSDMVFQFEGKGGHRRLEVTWSGRGNSPWHTGSDLHAEHLQRIAAAATGVPGLSNVRMSLTSSDRLRIWAGFPDDQEGKRAAEAKLEAAVRAALSAM